MKDFIVKYWLGFAFGLITTGGVAFYKRLEAKVHKQVNNQKALKDGTMALLRSEIISCYDKYMGRGWVPIYAMENALALYDAYHALGGNGAIDKLIEELKELPSKEQK